ncbi:MAG: hypothetical protein U0736_19255 [Gemmataceae bacterium]
MGQVCSPEPRPLVVLLNSTYRLQMASRKPIKTVINPKEGILTIRSVERDPTMVVLQGTAPGITRLELEDAEGTRECREVIVQADVEYLHCQLRKAIPLATITAIPNGTNSVILTGFVQRAEDVNVAQSVATSVGFTVINGLRLNGVQQVQLDVVVARVRREKIRNFGFNFLGNSRQSLYGSTVGNLTNASGLRVGVPAEAVAPGQFGPILGAVPTGGGGSANLFGGVIGNATGFLGFLQALETEGVAKILAQPRLVSLSGNPASFLDGGEQAIPVPAGLGQVGVQFERFGTTLNFIPVVLGNGRIHLEVEPEISFLDAAAGTTIQGTTVQGRVTQRVHTTVEMESGQTFVIGGMIQRVVNAQTNKVPLLGQLPFVGAAFSTKTFTEDEVELVVMVTPHLVDAQSSCQVAKVLPGQETRTPDDFELFLEGILEAPRGPRAVFHGNRYVPAHFNGPAANLFPCAGRGDGLPTTKFGDGHGGHGGVGGGCATGSCGVAAPLQLTTPVDTGSVISPMPTRPLPVPVPAGMPSLPLPTATPPVAAPQADAGPTTVPVSVEATPAASPPSPPVPGTGPTPATSQPEAPALEGKP